MIRAAQGTVLAGKYALVSKLGQGGMGAVWRAEHVQLRSPVAIKLIDQEIAENAEALARFMREAQSAAALRSPHVVQILDFGVDDGVPYIAMELLDGESLANRLDRVGHLSPHETARIVTDVSRAIAKAHETGIVHRDLKPDNIFIVRNDEQEIAKVLDFGIAKASTPGPSPGAATRTGAILGTPYYMSPEQAEGNRHVDHRTDLWALGVIAFECLLGRRPFDSNALGSLLLAICTRPIPAPSSHGRVPPGFDAWFSRACARDASARFQTARELASELRKVCGEAELDRSESRTFSGAETVPAASGTTPFGAPTASPYSTSIGLGKPRSSGVGRWIGAGVAASVVAGGAFFVLRGRSESPSVEPSTSAMNAEPSAASRTSAGTPSAPGVDVAPAPQAIADASAPATSAAAHPSPSASAARAAPVTPTRRTGRAPKQERPAATSTAAKTPAPAATATEKPAPKAVNLGI